MMADLAIRFILGGIVVSLFSALGEVFTPKRFAGIFGAAPSVALGTLALGFAKHGDRYVLVQCAGMLLGALALIAYCELCVWTADKPRLPVWLGAAMGWLVWGAIAAGAFWLVHDVVSRV
jgi:hypothetical protein